MLTGASDDRFPFVNEVTSDCDPGSPPLSALNVMHHIEINPSIKRGALRVNFPRMLSMESQMARFSYYPHTKYLHNGRLQETDGTLSSRNKQMREICLKQVGKQYIARCAMIGQDGREQGIKR